MIKLPFATALDNIASRSQAMLSDSFVRWAPSSGEPVCEAAVLFKRTEGGESFGGRPSSHEAIEYLATDLPGLSAGETITLVRGNVERECVVRDVDPFSVRFHRAFIGNPDFVRCA